MRKYLIAALAACVAMAFGGIALAQTPAASMSVHVSPKKAGTKKHPRNETLKLSITNNDVHKTLERLDIQLPKTLTISGKGLKMCNRSQFESTADPSICPKASKIGGGTADAALGVDQPTPAALHFDVTAYLVGKKALDFYLHSTGIPVNVVAPGRVHKTRKGQKLVVAIPEQAQQPATGVFAGLVSLNTSLGKHSGRHKLIASTGCKHHKQRFSAKLHFAANPARPASTATAQASAKCRP